MSTSIKIIPVTGVGQIVMGDVLLLKRHGRFIAPVEVKQVLRAGEESEEIILSKTKNLYFVMSMFLKGSSWVKECAKLDNGRLYSLTNNARDITMYHEDEHPGQKPMRRPT
jgi:hypothetical protein